MSQTPFFFTQDFFQKRIHILGIAGTLMGAFAQFLKKSGVTVTGSDQNIYPPMSDVLKENEIQVFSPFQAQNLVHAKPDLVIVGNVIRKVNPEMQAVLEQGIPYISLPETLEKYILPHKHSIVVSGTHGKTTTTSMMAWILETLKTKPSFFIGGVVQNFPESFRITDGKYMVLEGDEYDTAFFDKVPKFVHYKPTDVILTSIEYDHADIYPDMNAVIAAFERLMTLIPEAGYLVVCAESEIPIRVAQKTKARIVTYGFSARVDSQARNVKTNASGMEFEWVFEGQHRQVQLNGIGQHNVLNALACLTLAQLRELEMDQVVAALKTYQGVKRRQEVYGTAKGITLIDDFAHHPTAVRETLEAIKGQYAGQRVVVCFEPRSATSRKKVFQKAYSESFDGAHRVWIAKPYTATQSANEDFFSSEDLITDLIKRGLQAQMLMTADEGISELRQTLKSGDVVVVMSNGSFDGLLPKLLQKL